MKNVTITLEESVARWARIAAAKREISLARFVGEILREHMEQQADYEKAMRDYLAIAPAGGSGGNPLPSREEIHDRAALRRQ